MKSRRTRRIQYIILSFVIVLVVQSIRKNLFTSTNKYVYDAEVHEFVPAELRPFVSRSSTNYTVDDLLNLTNIPEELPSNSVVNSVHLLTQWYSETNRRRREELVSVLYMNVINDAVTNIHFIQNSKNCTVFDDVEIYHKFPVDLLRQKLIIHYTENTDLPSRRLTINQAFSYANHFITHGYIVLINLDIFFDRSLVLLKHRPLLDRKTVLYLSRYEVDPSITTLGLQCSEKGYVGSHDALIFQSPLPADLLDKFPYEIGTWHIEVKIIYELLQADYIVRNTCKSIRVWHFHSSQIRHRLMPSTKYFPDRRLTEIFKYPELL